MSVNFIFIVIFAPLFMCNSLWAVEDSTATDRPKVLLVSGSSGRVGEKVCERFSKEYTVVGFDILEPKQKYPNSEYVYMDISSDESVRNAFNYVKQKYGNHVTAFIHLAAYYNFTGEKSDLYDKINVQGTSRVLDALKNFVCDQFYYASTMLVYAPCGVNESINEDWPLDPKWDYPKSKLKAEEVIHEKKGQMPTVIMRIAGCYDDECHSIPISHQVQRIYEKQLASHVFPGNISHGVSYLHFDDLTEAIWKSVEMRSKLPRELLLVVGEGKTMSYDRLQRQISKLLFGNEITTYQIPKWLAKIGAWIEGHIPFVQPPFIKPWMIDLADDNYNLDISHALHELNWRPKHFVGDVIPKMIENLEKDPKAWYETNELKTRV